MKKLILGLALACVALASDSPKDYDDRVTVAGVEGTWRAVSGEENGQAVPPAQLQNAQLTFKDGRAALVEGGRQSQSFSFRTDTSRRPAHLDLTMLDGFGKNETLRMIYSIEGNVLKIAFYTSDRSMRPTAFKMGPGANMRVIVLKREGN